MLARVRRVDLRGATRPRHGQTRIRRNHAHPVHRRARMPVIVPLLILAAGGLAIAPLTSTRATPPTTWAPLPASAFRPLTAPDATAADRGLGERSDRSKALSPGSGTAPTGINFAADRTMPDRPERPRPEAAPIGAGGASADTSWVASVRPARTAGTPPAGPTHVVVPGDNLWTIARRHKADLAAVIRWNEGLDPRRLMAGRRVLIPGGSKMAPLPRPRPTASSPAAVRPAAGTRAPAPTVATGNHLWPLPVRGLLTRGFSAAHLGIDIAAPQGTRLRAIAAGTVVWAGWMNNGGGFVVVVEHPDGMTSTYNHNSKVTVAKGAVINRGDTIALVGSTGNSTGPHLDFRIQIGGRFVDPLDLY